LNKNQQADLFQRLAATLLPRGKAPRVNASLLREMWRCAASLEALPAGTRTDLGNTLVKRIRNNDATPSEFWCLARLGARKLFYGPANQVLPADYTPCAGSRRSPARPAQKSASPVSAT